MNLRLIAPLLLIIFSGCYCQPSPNGKEGKLMFEAAPQHQPFGAESRINIPEHVLLPGKSGKLELGIAYDDQLDFRDTTLETKLTGALEVLEVTQKENRDYQVRMLCKADTSSTPAELRVKIKRDGRVQYEDALDIFCYRNPRTTSDHDGEAWLIDRRVDVHLKTTDEAGQMFLDTHALKFPENGPFALAYEDGGVPENLYNGQPIRLRTMAPGASLQFSSGEFSASVPVRVLGDDEWKLELSVTKTEPSATGSFFVFKGTAVAPGYEDGGVKGLGDCELHVVEVNGNSSQSGSLDNCQSSIIVNDRPYRACMQRRGNVGCLLLSPDGGVEASDGGV